MGSIRILLALAVVVGHARGLWGYEPLSSVTAVQAFYVISGFYMSLILAEKYTLERDGSRWLRLFWTNRYLRLAPSYFAILVLSILSSAIFSEAWRNSFFPSEDWTGNLIELAAKLDLPALALAGSANLTMFFQDTLDFLSFDPALGHLAFQPVLGKTTLPSIPLWIFSFNPPSWSISVELLFYSIAPVLLRCHLRVVIFAALLSYAVRLALFYAGLRFDPWVHRVFPAELMFFLWGNLAYRFYARHRASSWLAARGPALLAAILAAGLISNYVPAGHRELRYAFLILLTGALPFVFAASRNWRLDNYVGRLSYPVYIAHWVVLANLSFLGPWTGAATIAATLVLALLLMVLIEDPVDRWRQRRVARAGRNPGPVSLAGVTG